MRVGVKRRSLCSGEVSNDFMERITRGKVQEKHTAEESIFTTVQNL